LAKKVKARASADGRPGVQRTHSAESLAGKEPVLGLPPDPSKDLEEMMQEAKAEFEARQRRGSVMRGTQAPEKKEL